MPPLQGPQRFIVKISVQDIPGSPSARPFSLQETFSEKVLERPPRLEPCPDGFDAVHIPPDFDTENDVRRWFIFDTGVTGCITRDDLRKVPLKAYLGRRDDKHELVFTPRMVNEGYVKYFSMYTWGAGQCSEALK